MVMSKSFVRIVNLIIFLLSFVIMCLLSYDRPIDFVAALLAFIIFYTSFMTFMFTFEDSLKKIRYKNIKKRLNNSIKVKSDEEIANDFHMVGLNAYGNNLKKVYFSEDGTKRAVITANENGTFISPEKLVIIFDDNYYDEMDYARWEYDMYFPHGDYYADIDTLLNDCKEQLKDYHEEKIPEEVFNTKSSFVTIRWKTKRLKRELPYGSNYPVLIRLSNGNEVEAKIFPDYWYDLNSCQAYLYTYYFKLEKKDKFYIIEDNKIVAKGKIIY